MDTAKFNTRMQISEQWHQAKIGPQGLSSSSVRDLIASIDADGVRSPEELSAASSILEYSMANSDERDCANELCEELGIPVEDHGFLSLLGDMVESVAEATGLADLTTRKAG